MQRSSHRPDRSLQIVNCSRLFCSTSLVPLCLNKQAEFSWNYFKAFVLKFYFDCVFRTFRWIQKILITSAKYLHVFTSVFKRNYAHSLFSLYIRSSTEFAQFTNKSCRLLVQCCLVDTLVIGFARFRCARHYRYVFHCDVLLHVL